jgi:signal transduction histidine kinase
MVEMRRMLEVLEPSTRAVGVPAPSLDGLPALVARTEQAGLPVDLTVRGTSGSLPATVELTAYRIVQEALTNVLKHAGPTSVEVDVDHRRDALQVRVRDRGVGVGATGASRNSDATRRAGGSPDGRGIRGMRHRVAALRGSITAGPHPDAGFEVLAELPVEPPDGGAS